MVEKIRKEIDELFQQAPHTKKIQELKEEMISNLEEKYLDLVSCGKTEQEAFDISMASLGDVEGLIRSVSESEGKFFKMPQMEKKVSLEKHVSLDKKETSSIPSDNKASMEAAYKDEPKKYQDAKQPKKTDVVSLTILSCLGVFILFVIVRVIAAMSNGGNVGHIQADISFGEMAVAKEESVKIDNIDKIKMQLYRADVEVSVWNEKDVKVIESTNDNEKKELFTIEKSGDTLKITRPDVHSMTLFDPLAEHKVQVFIPESYKKQLEVETSSGDIALLTDLEVKKLELIASSGSMYGHKICKAEDFSQSISSGYIEFDELITEQYKVKASSGDVSYRKLKGKGEINTSSGDVLLDEIEGDSHKIITTSGTIEIEKGIGDFELSSNSGGKKIGMLSGSKHKIMSSSGDIEVEEMQGSCEISGSSSIVSVEKYSGEELDITTSSGNVCVGMDELLDTCEIKTSSGEVKLDREGNVDAKITFKTSSGSIDSDSEIIYDDKKQNKGEIAWGNGNAHKISIQTSSGDIEVSD